MIQLLMDMCAFLSCPQYIWGQFILNMVHIVESVLPFSRVKCYVYYIIYFSVNIADNHRALLNTYIIYIKIKLVTLSLTCFSSHFYRKECISEINIELCANILVVRQNSQYYRKLGSVERL